MRHRLKILFAVGATVAVLGGAGAPAWAHASGSFGASPAHSNPADPATRSYFKPVIAPGGSYSDQVLLSNTSSGAVHLIVSAVDGLTGQTSGSVYANRQDRVRKAGAWVKPSVGSVTLAPHSHQLVAFTVKVPASATPGDHLAGIAFENAVPTTSGSQFGVKEIVRTVVGVDIDVPGSASPHIKLGALALGALPGLRFATLTINIADDGRKLEQPVLRVTLSGPGKYDHTVVRKLDTILPGDSIAYPFIWPDDLAAGDYHVTVVATNGSERETRTAILHLGTKLRGTVRPRIAGASSVPWPLSPPAMIVIGFAVVMSTLLVGFRAGSRREARRTT